MNYELAKELKDAGFPQKWHAARKEIKFPTLSELIEACVVLTTDGDFHLEHLHDEWGAAPCNGSYSPDDWERGKTPEEAVARLWLALHPRHE